MSSPIQRQWCKNYNNNHTNQEKKNESFQALKVNTCEPQVLYLLKLSSSVDGEIVIFQDKSKFWQFMTTNHKDRTAERSWRNTILVGVRKISFLTKARERVYSVKGIEGQREPRKETSTSTQQISKFPKSLWEEEKEIQRTQQNRTSFNKYERNIKHL